MCNTVIIRASRCIYAVPIDEYKLLWKPYVTGLFIRVGQKFVTLEYKEHRIHHDETDFIKHILPMIPYESQLQALRRGKGIMRTEKSYSTKGSGKHGTTHRYR